MGVHVNTRIPPIKRRIDVVRTQKEGLKNMSSHWHSPAFFSQSYLSTSKVRQWQHSRNMCKPRPYPDKAYPADLFTPAGHLNDYLQFCCMQTILRKVK